jgi:hypothetical protein
LKESQFTLISPSKFAVDDDGNLSQMPSTEIFKKNYWSAGCITAIDPHDWLLLVWAGLYAPNSFSSMRKRRSPACQGVLRSVNDILVASHFIISSAGGGLHVPDRPNPFTFSPPE